MTPRLPAALIADLRREVREEIRVAGVLDAPSRPHLPPPHDIEGERMVAGSVLCGYARPSALPVTARDFYWPLAAAVFATCAALEELDRTPSPALVLVLLERQGCVGSELSSTVQSLYDHTPLVTHLTERAARVASLARARALLAHLVRIDVELRLGVHDFDSARAELASLIAPAPPAEETAP